MRVLVTGAAGLLGGRLAALLSRRFHVVAGRHDSPILAGLSEAPIDLTSPASIERALDEARAEAVVHAAAIADPDRCERDPELATRLNTGGCEALARLCHARSLPLVALSTDLVFSGERAFLTESDTPAPLQVYGRTKLAGEQAILALHPTSAILRVALVLGRGHGPRATASEAVAWALRNGRRPRLFTDQYRTPIDAESVSSLIERLLVGGGAGIFHAGGAERLSRWDLGRRVAGALGLAAEPIEPVTKADIRQPAPRPADVSLDSTKAERLLGWRPRPLATGIVEGRRVADEPASA